MFGLKHWGEKGRGATPYADEPPVCGLDRCARCAACLGCAADTACQDDAGKEHVWVLTPRRQQRQLARELVHTGLRELAARWEQQLLASGCRLERDAGEAA